MQRIGHFKPAGQPFAVGKILRSLVWLLAFAAISARADLTISPPEKILSASLNQPQNVGTLEQDLIKPARPANRAPLLIMQKNLGVHGRSNERMLVSAGCGQMWGDASMFRKICPDHQDPSWAYVKASFSF
jgi:hypothetical protein